MSARPVAIDARAAAAWPFLRGIVLAVPGTIIQGPSGEQVRIREDGGADEVNAVPARKSIASDPTARGAR